MKKASAFVGGAVATAAIPFSNGVMDWRILAASAVLGGIGGMYGVNVPSLVKKYAKKAGTKNAPP